MRLGFVIRGIGNKLAGKSTSSFAEPPTARNDSSMESARERKAANEAIFREVNEQVLGLQEKFALDHNQPLTLVCECDRMACAETVRTTVETYETIRQDGACFLVLAGHEDPTVEDVVHRTDGYVVVRKHPGEPRAVALETDPRS
jgi:hypothetical protein